MLTDSELKLCNFPRLAERLSQLTVLQEVFSEEPLDSLRLAAPPLLILFLRAHSIMKFLSYADNKRDCANDCPDLAPSFAFSSHSALPIRS
ncbi:hypothetical protein [Streptomyces collinus]